MVQVSISVDNDTVLPVSASIFTRSFTVVLGFIHTVRTKKCSSLGQSISFLSGLIVVHSHVFYTCVLLSEQKNMGPSGIWKLQLKMSHTCGGPQFFSWCLGWFLLIFSWFQRKRLCVSGVPPINSNGISLLIRGFLSSEWNHMEFSFCLKTHSTLCMYTSDFDESDKKKSIKVLPCSILTFNKCKKC